MLLEQDGYKNLNKNEIKKDDFLDIHNQFFRGTFR